MAIVRRDEGSKLWDVFAAAPQIILCAFGALGFLITIHRQWPSQFDIAIGLQITSEFVATAFLLFQALMLCIRRLPISKASGIAPRLSAVLGANFSYLILLIPRMEPNPSEAIVSSTLILLGTGGALLTMGWLSRSFAIFPQARQLVTTGPYKFVRHPLYLAEQISAFGVALQFRQPWGILIVLGGFALQFPRMRYEESILEKSFPIYSGYARRTPKIIPFL